jgi:hypothetical protein
MDRNKILLLLSALGVFVLLGVLSYAPGTPLHGNLIVDWTMKGMIMVVCAYFFFGRYRY